MVLIHFHTTVEYAKGSVDYTVGQSREFVKRPLKKEQQV